MLHPRLRSCALILFLVILVHLLPLLSTTTHPFFQVQQQPQEPEALQAIERAQSAINTAYFLLMHADSAGAYIDDIVSNLNQAIDALNKARWAFNNSDFSSAITFAENAEGTAEVVSEQAILRHDIARIQLQTQVLIILVVGIIAVTVSYFLVTRWRTYRRQKRREFLQMEIRLPEDDEEGDADE